MIDTTEEKKDQPKKSCGFFSVSLAAIREIARQFQKPEHVVIYIVIARHATTRGKFAGRISTAGLHAVSKKTKTSRRTATFVSEDLENSGFITSIKNNTDTEIPKFLGKSQGIGNSIRWVINHEYLTEDRVYFPNAIVEGVGRGKENPPLCKIMSLSGEIKRRPGDARLDVLMVLTIFYYHHQLFACGGIDPMEAVCRKWDITQTSFTDEYGVVGYLNDITLVAATKDSSDCKIIVTDSIISQSMPHIVNKVDRKIRFSEAFNELFKNLCYIYEVLQIWDSDPTKNEYARVLYPLYIFDTYEREKELYLQKVINTAANLLLEDPPAFIDKDMANLSELYDHERNGVYIFAEGGEEMAYPLSVFRLKYKPNTADAADWLKREQESIIEWRERIMLARQSEISSQL